MLKVHGHEIFQDIFGIFHCPNPKSKILQICRFFLFYPKNPKIFEFLHISSLNSLRRNSFYIRVRSKICWDVLLSASFHLYVPWLKFRQ